MALPRVIANQRKKAGINDSGRDRAFTSRALKRG